MSLILTLPILDGARIIVIDEGAEVKYADSLITAWLPIWKSKESRNINLLLFSSPKSSSKIYLNSISENQVKVHDFYTLSLDTIDPFEDNKLWEILQLDSLGQNSIVIIDSLSSLLLYKGLSETCKFIDKLGSKVSQLICIYQRDFSHTKIPSIKTLGTSYVQLVPSRSLKLEHNLSYKTLTSHCKPGGGILQQIEIIEQNFNSYEIRTEKVNHKGGQKPVTDRTESAEKIQASFRIEINDREMKQRNATPLPYTLNSLPLSESKIHYEPDEVDDLDEEDPDDDLDF